MSYTITSPEIWFLKTIDERNASGIYRLRALPGQYVPDEDGTMVITDETINVQAPSQPRQDNPVGTIFFCKTLKTEKNTTGTKFYNAGKQITSMAGGVSSDVQNAFREYQAQVGIAVEEPVSPTTGTKKGPVAKSLIEDLVDKFPCPTIKSDNFYVKPDLWRTLLFNIHQGYNTMLMGESGTGKTELTIMLAKAMGKEIKIFDMGAKQDPIASLVGVHRFDGGKSIFDRADFTHTIEQDVIAVLDELPRAPMNTNNILFPVLDSRRELNMDIASHELRSIKVNPACRFIATANEGFRYTGNNILDQALKERFQILVIDFMPADMETDLLMKRSSVSKAEGNTIVKTATQIRTLAAKDELNMGVSTRHTLYAAALRAGGFTLPQAMEQAFLPLYTIAEEQKKVKDLLAAR